MSVPARFVLLVSVVPSMLLASAASSVPRRHVRLGLRRHERARKVRVARERRAKYAARQRRFERAKKARKARALRYERARKARINAMEKKIKSDGAKATRAYGNLRKRLHHLQ